MGIYTELENAQFAISNGIDIIYVIWEAIVEGSSTGDSYANALWAAHDYLKMYNEKMDELIETSRKQSLEGKA